MRLPTRTVIKMMLIACTAALTLALPLAAAQAHAAYVSSDPAANSVLTKAPTSVKITFAQPLDPKGLSIIVYGNTGKPVSTGTAQIVTGDPNSASVTMVGDGSDIYRVDWTTVSALDSDPTLGAFVFGVDPSGKTDKVPPPAGTTSPSASAGVSPWVTVLIGLVGLALGAGATYYLLRVRPTP